MSDIDLTEAYDAAAEVVRRNARVRPNETVIDAAVVPNILGAYRAHVEAAVRDKIAREIEAKIGRNIGGHPFSDADRGMARAARIARGAS